MQKSKGRRDAGEDCVVFGEAPPGLARVVPRPLWESPRPKKQKLPCVVPERAVLGDGVLAWAGERGMVLGEASKFGASFLGYLGDPETTHAEYLLFDAPAIFGDSFTARALVSCVRTAHNNKKKALVCEAEGDGTAATVCFDWESFDANCAARKKRRA